MNAPNIVQMITKNVAKSPLRSRGEKIFADVSSWWSGQNCGTTGHSSNLVKFWWSVQELWYSRRIVLMLQFGRGCGVGITFLIFMGCAVVWRSIFEFGVRFSKEVKFAKRVRFASGVVKMVS